MRENRTYGSMRRGGKRVMVHSANGHRTRKGGNSGAPPDLDTTALAPHSTLNLLNDPMIGGGGSQLGRRFAIQVCHRTVGATAESPLARYAKELPARGE